MTTLLLLMFSLDTNVFQDLDIDDIPSRHNAVVSTSGHLFLLDVYTGTVFYYDPDGKRLGPLGSKGSGPGEYNQIQKIFALDDQVVLWDRMGGNVLLYDAQGTFLDSLKTPNNCDLLPTPDGWACGTWLMAGGPKEPVRVLVADRAFEEQRVALSWHPEGSDPLGRTVRRASPTVGVSFPFNPSPDNPLIAYASGTGKIYVYQPGKTFRIHIVDAASGKQVGTIRRDMERIPFDDAWGEQRIKQIQEQTSSRGSKVKLSPNFPEFFPLVGMLLVSAEGPVVVGRWKGGDQPYHLFAIDDEGKDAQLSYDPAKEFQVLAIQGGTAWLGVDLGDKKPGVVKVPKEKIAETLEAYDSKG